jgi:hypothetical protein
LGVPDRRRGAPGRASPYCSLPRRHARPHPAQNVGRHLPLSAMRTCRLVCRRWAAVIGESVAAVGVGADMLRSAVLTDPPAGRGEGGEGSDEGGGPGPDGPDTDSSDDEGDAEAADGGSGGAAAAGAGRAAASPDEATSPGGVAALERARRKASAMRRLRRLSRRLGRAFPRAHTCVLHVDVG